MKRWRPYTLKCVISRINKKLQRGPKKLSLLVKKELKYICKIYIKISTNQTYKSKPRRQQYNLKWQYGVECWPLKKNRWTKYMLLRCDNVGPYQKHLSMVVSVTHWKVDWDCTAMSWDDHAGYEFYTKQTMNLLNRFGSH